MATKKAAVATKKSAAKKQSITKVTTIKATEPRAHTVTTAVTKSNSRFMLSQVSISAVLAEFVGTFIFTAAIIASQGSPVIVGFTLIGLVLAISTLSNAHFNPALSIAAWLTRRISGKRALAYAVAQVLGSMLALVILNWFAHASNASTVTDPTTGQATTGALQLFAAAAIPSGKEWYVFAAEVLGTFIFGFTVASIIRAKERVSVAFTMGFGLFAALLIASSAAGVIQATAILNPAVAIALQALSFKVWPIAIYVLGPILGAVIGFIIFDLLKNNDEKVA
ncbi:MAG: aquaporin [Candidatus Saccharimonadales bacterium]